MEILDTILRTFVDALKAGTLNLGMYSVPILGVFVGPQLVLDVWAAPDDGRR